MSAEMEPVIVQYFKYDGSAHWRHEMVRLGEDHHGVWLGARAGAVVQLGEEPAIAWPTPWVQLVRPGAWWTMIYNDDQSEFRIYADIVTPARWVSGNRVELVDLDLDVIGHHDGAARIDDADEFEDHRRRWGYPPELVAAARTAAARVLDHVRTAREPFGTAGARWLHLVT